MAGDIDKKELDSLMSKYKNKLSDNLTFNKNSDSGDFMADNDDNPHEYKTQEYEEFKKEYLPKKLNIYEKLCEISEKYIKLKPKKEMEETFQKAIDTCHMNVTPTGANSFPYLAFFAIIVAGLIFGYFLPFTLALLTGGEWTSFFFVIFSVIVGVILLIPLGKIPMFLANDWKMQASNQLVMSVFYTVTFMRHTSNLELAIDFASDHLSPPISLDFKRIVWNLETGKFDNIKDSIEEYLKDWKKTNMEFVESMHLIMGSLYESSEERRVEALDKSLNVILEGTYEKMMKYAHELKSPITMITMLGVILPILTLVIAPLAINFMGGIEWYHLAAFYNMALPFSVYYMSKIALSTRPGSGSISNIGSSEKQKEKQNLKFKLAGKEIKLKPFQVALIVGITIFIVAISPFIINAVTPEGWDLVFGPENKQIKLLEYKEIDKKMKGPFGLISSLISILLPLSLALSLGTYFRLRSKGIMEVREKVKKLEDEFASALFQLGNRLGDGLPAEIAFSKVAEIMDDSATGNFFKEVSNKISKLGMSVDNAIFNKETGVLNDYPSNLIESSMKVLVESSKKGPKIASQALINVSNYIKEMHKVNERVQDLMSEIISGLKGQISFLAPTLTGIVVGITSMIGTIMGKLNNINGMDEAGGGGMLSEMFKASIPTYHFQAVVGVYIVQLVFVLTIMVNSIQNGKDKDGERYSLGQNMIKGPLKYGFIAFAVMTLFNIVGISILGNM